jgi:hypothetical protein
VAVAGERRFPSRKADRLSIEHAIKDLRNARHRLKRNAGPAGRLGLRLAGHQIASALSVTWMRRQFPGDRAVPNVIYWPADDQGGREPERIPSRPIDTDDLTLGQRIGLMERRGGEAIAALLGDIADALESGRRAIVHLPTGRKALEHRRYWLAALAELWHRLGRKPTSGDRSKFGEFSEAVCDAIGWPTDGVKSALPEAIQLWRSLYR